MGKQSAKKYSRICVILFHWLKMAGVLFLVGLYASNDDEPICLLRGHKGGITELKFTTDGFYLFSGARKVCGLLIHFYKEITLYYKLRDRCFLLVMSLSRESQRVKKF